MENKYTDASDSRLLQELKRLSLSSDKASVILASLLDDDFFEAITEARRRCTGKQLAGYLAVQESLPSTSSGRMKNAHSIEVDPNAFRALLYGRRISLSQAGKLIGLSDGWASAVCCKRRTSAATLERLAIELDIRFDDLVMVIGTDSERAREGLMR